MNHDTKAAIRRGFALFFAAFISIFGTKMASGGDLKSSAIAGAAAGGIALGGFLVPSPGQVAVPNGSVSGGGAGPITTQQAAVSAIETAAASAITTQIEKGAASVAGTISPLDGGGNA